MKVFENLGLAEKLKVTVLMDDYAGYESGYLASHGISLMLQVASSNCTKNILLDVGQSAPPLIHNMRLAGIQPSDIDMIFLSHCHYDHTQALTDLLIEIGKEIPVIAHPDIFRKNFGIDPHLRYIGMSNKNSPHKIEELGGQLILVKEPLSLMEGVLSTGEVERTTDFEGKGIGTYNLVDGKPEPDGLLDDISIAINIKDKGLFIATGCSHAGIINIIKHVINITGINKVYGIIGGLHLIKAGDDLINKTVEHLLEFNPEIIIPGHCTGLRAQYLIAQRFGEKYTPMYSGKTLCL